MRVMSTVWRNLGVDLLLTVVLRLLYEGLDPFADQSALSAGRGGP